ncbi:response regulator transcription factor [Streptomyces anulatus]
MPHVLGRTPPPATLDGPVLVDVAAADPLSRAGVAAQLRPRPEVRLLDEEDRAEAGVLVLVADTVDEEVRATIRRTRRTTATRTLLVLASIDEHQLLGAAECGVSGIIRRDDASPELLVQVICAVAGGDGHLSGDLLGQLLEAVGKVQKDLLGPRGLHFGGITDREREVLRLLAEGDDTADIARKVNYSGRTVKNIIRSFVERLQLRNRTHAVAYAMRHGLI